MGFKFEKFYKTKYSNFYKKYNWAVKKKISSDIVCGTKFYSVKNSIRAYRYNRLRFRVFVSPLRMISFRFKKLKKNITFKKSLFDRNKKIKESVYLIKFFSKNYTNKKLKQKNKLNSSGLLNVGFYKNNLYNFENINKNLLSKFSLNFETLSNLNNKKNEINHIRNSLIENSNILGFKSKFYFNFSDSNSKFFKNWESLGRSFKSYDRPKSYHEFLMEHYNTKNKFKKIIEKTLKRKLNYQWFTYFCRFDEFPLYGIRSKRIKNFYMKKYLKTKLSVSYYYNKYFTRATEKFSVKNINYEYSEMGTWPKPLKYNPYRHTNNRYVSYYKKSKLDKKKDKELFKSFLRYLKKVFKWKKLIVKKFRKLGWGWKRKFIKNKKKLASIKKNLSKKIIDKGLFVFPEDHEDFVGIKLINKLKKVTIKKSMLFWTKNRFCLWRSKPFHLTGYFWSKFNLNLMKLHKDHSYLYKIPRNENRRFFFKRELFLWKFKNMFVARKHKQFADRFYPKKWYKVKRKKFPLKRHLKDWSLRLSKMHVFKYNGVTFPSLYTFYDSSSVYYKNISSTVKPKKYKNIHRIKNMYKQQDIDRDLEIFRDDVKNPPFAKFAGRKQYFFSWKAKQPFKVLEKNPLYGNSAPSLYTRTISAIEVKKLKTLEIAMFKYYSKKQSLFLKKRLDSFMLHLDLVFAKVKPLVISKEPGFVLKTIFETKSFKDLYGSRTNYYENSFNRYNIMLKNFIYTKQISNSAIIKSFAQHSVNLHKLMNYTLSASGRSASVLKYFKDNAEQSHKKSMLFIYTSRYRHPTYEIRHSHRNHSKFYKEINNLSGYKRINLVVGRFFKNNSTTKETFKNIDFMKNRRSGYQFRHKVSTFYKKNMWIFNGFDSISTSYSVKTII